MSLQDTALLKKCIEEAVCKVAGERMGMAGSMNSCSNCRYWMPEDSEIKAGWGLCARGGLCGGKPEDKQSTAVALDYAIETADLYTAPEHFCSMWREKTDDK